MHPKETAGTAFLSTIMHAIPAENYMGAVNSILLYEKDEEGKRHYRGHLLVRNSGNGNLLGPHYAQLDEEGDGWYLTSRRHFYLEEAHHMTGVYYLLFGKAVPVEPVFDREPKVGYENTYCPICGDAVPMALISCRKEKANVCQDCCGRCRYNSHWSCMYKTKQA